MSFNLQQLKQMAAESGMPTSARSKRLIVNDYMDGHPVLRGDLIEIAQNRDSYRRLYDQQRAMEECIRSYDRQNGEVLSNLEIEPSRLIEYAVARVNRHLEHSARKQGLLEAPRVSRGRITERALLTDESAQ